MRRAMPYAFTEQGVAMLSSVLNEEIQQILTYLKKLFTAPPPPPRNLIGFKT